jgi:hypothetical protein
MSAHDAASDPERHYAQRHEGVTVEQVREWAQELWQRSFVAQRDEQALHRGGPNDSERTRRAYKASVTRGMYDELDRHRLSKRERSEAPETD